MRDIPPEGYAQFMDQAREARQTRILIATFSSHSLHDDSYYQRPGLDVAKFILAQAKAKQLLRSISGRREQQEAVIEAISDTQMTCRLPKKFLGLSDAGNAIFSSPVYEAQHERTPVRDFSARLLRTKREKTILFWQLKQNIIECGPGRLFADLSLGVSSASIAAAEAMINSGVITQRCGRPPIQPAWL